MGLHAHTIGGANAAAQPFQAAVYAETSID
jgi:hypothetical protein